MSKKKSLFFSAAILLVCVSSSLVEGRELLKDFDWSVTTPAGFLELLSTKPHDIAVIKKENRPPTGWIRDVDAEELIALVDYKAPAAPVISEESPSLPGGPSTIGNEAMFLLKGFRTGAYPPGLSSIDDFKGDPNEYKRWWVEFLYRREGTRKTGGGSITVSNRPSPQVVLEDSKPRNLPAVDSILLNQEAIRIGAARIDVLTNRITGAVEYVWSPPYNRYVRPKFVLPNVENLRRR